MNVYFLSGLGADKRAFAGIRLPDKFIPHHIDWIRPEKKELLPAYARRLAKVIDSSQPFVLIGLSFGGIVAIEINKFLKAEQIIIISSVSTRSQLPPHHRQAGLFQFYRILPYWFFKTANPLNYWIFGARTKDEKVLLKQILKDMDTEFLKWAIGRLTTWDNKVKPENLYHIHGTADMLMPILFVKPDLKIKKGGHLMVHNFSHIISAAIEDRLNEMAAVE